MDEEQERTEVRRRVSVTVVMIAAGAAIQAVQGEPEESSAQTEAAPPPPIVGAPVREHALAVRSSPDRPGGSYGPGASLTLPVVSAGRRMRGE